MNSASKTCICVLLLAFTSGVGMAQQPAPTPAPSPTPAPPTPAPPPGAHSTAQIDAGEPRANSMPSPAGTPAEPPAAPAPAAGRTSSKPAAASHGQGAAAGATGAAGQRGATAADRLNLNTATVTGDREQPKVLYIVPWKSSTIGDLSGKPMNSLLDEALAPVDREEFKREVAYYDAVRANTPQNGASPPAKQGEK